LLGEEEDDDECCRLDGNGGGELDVPKWLYLFLEDGSERISYALERVKLLEHTCYQERTRGSLDSLRYPLEFSFGICFTLRKGPIWMCPQSAEWVV
jgi:hypothetical protein